MGVVNLLTGSFQVVSLKKMKRELESKVEELEDEVDDLNIKVDSLQQVRLHILVVSLLVLLLLGKVTFRVVTEIT